MLDNSNYFRKEKNVVMDKTLSRKCELCKYYFYEAMDFIKMYHFWYGFKV